MPKFLSGSILRSKTNICFYNSNLTLLDNKHWNFLYGNKKRVQIIGPIK